MSAPTKRLAIVRSIDALEFRYALTRDELEDGAPIYELRLRPHDQFDERRFSIELSATNLDDALAAFDAFAAFARTYAVA